jgi:serine/threonine-protein kinase RsbW
MKRLRRPAILQSLAEFRSFLNSALEHQRVDPARRLEIELTLEELITNVVRYAYPPESPGEVELGYRLEPPHELRVFLTDWGRRFNPLKRRAPELSADLDHRPLGGLGIYLARQFSDQLEYRYADSANRVSLRFNLLPPAGA